MYEVPPGTPGAEGFTDEQLAVIVWAAEFLVDRSVEPPADRERAVREEIKLLLARGLAGMFEFIAALVEAGEAMKAGREPGRIDIGTVDRPTLDTYDAMARDLIRCYGRPVAKARTVPRMRSRQSHRMSAGHRRTSRTRAGPDDDPGGEPPAVGRCPHCGHRLARLADGRWCCPHAACTEWSS